ncbi:nuclease-related domain-containing protein [Vibrio sp. YMD68]|uniref:nuclease-related domain-containing protein n=1 Tax=Vibrio sp. YMD68 TaxID=3042300 RepID=UPI00249BFB33|nr:nuclease-related domain-containing protein [Vibrio sp. YMD68]WGV99107.1 nuclease-related domain-containing protein [Vibrio sp. YMD68]
METFLSIVLLGLLALCILGWAIKLLEFALGLVFLGIIVMSIWAIVALIETGFWPVALILFAALIIGGVYTSTNKFKGKQGEAKVNKKLSKLCKNTDSQFLSNVTIHYKNRTAQIDHILITKAGVFVIETKNFGGTISAKLDEMQWVQHLGETTNRFYSPTWQNETHIAALDRLLNLDNALFVNTVVFTRTKEPLSWDTGDPLLIVTRLQELEKKLAAYEGEWFSSVEINKIKEIIESERLPVGRETDKYHLQNINRDKV